MADRIEIDRATARRPFTPRATPLADRVDTTNAPLEFAAEADAEVFLPERRTLPVHIAPAPIASPLRRAVATQNAAPAVHGVRRLLWLMLAVAFCAPLVSIALRDTPRAVPPRAATPPSPRAPAEPPVSPADPPVSSPLPKTPPEPRRTIQNSPAPAARVLRPAPRVTVPAAPATTPAGFSGDLHVVSEPPGARVFVNGRPVGSTPLVLADLSVGSRVVRIEADGYLPWTSAVRVVADQQTRVEATLKR